MPCLSLKKLFLIEPVMFMYFLYSSGSNPLQSQFVRDRLLKDYPVQSFSNNTCNFEDPYMNYNDVDAQASKILMYMNIAALIPAFFATILFGGYSDKMGRSIVLVLPLTGAFLRLVTLSLTAYFNLGTFFLILSSLLDGMCGMSCMMLMACFSYLSDITLVEHRSIRVVILEISGSVGTVASHLAIGYLISGLGFLSTFVVLLSIICINLIYVVFILAESRPVDDKSQHSVLSLESFRDACSVYIKNDDLNMKIPRLFCLVSMFLVSFVQIGQSDVQTLLMLMYPLCLQSIWIGYFNAILFSVTAFSNFLFTKLFSNLLGDVPLILAGCIFGIGFVLMFGFASTKTALLLSCVVGCGALIPIAMIRAYSSKIVPSNKTGIMYSTIALMQMLGILFGSISQNSIFAASVGFMPNLVFIFDAMMYLFISIAVIIFLIYMRKCHSVNFPEDEQEIIT